MKVYVVLDFSFRDGDEIVIYDWKTGRSESEDNTMQLACYSLYAMNRWGVSPEDVKTIEFNLAKNQIKEYHTGGIEVEDVCEHIRKSSREMLGMLVSPEENKAEEENFPYTDNERSCRFCNFKKECPKYA